MKVILLVGPSGSGKDTLLRTARRQFENTGKITLVRRYITRPPGHDEDNYYVDNTCFSILKMNNFFISCWQAHGNEYGIPHHIFKAHDGIATFLCSISREAVSDFEHAFQNVIVVQVTVPQMILRQRLQKRGRENPSDIEQRIKRSTKPFQAKNLVTFDNSADLEHSQQDFIALLQSM
jgi:phosphonate metabolism protein PhnN/1,5-bisphosphokinase (PRPP-forming)